MKEDYLWDRTGSDAGIEDLERTLGTLRFEGTTAPGITQQSEAPAPRRFRFRLAFSGAAFASAVIAASVFFAVYGTLYDARELSVSLENRPTPVEAVEIPDPPAIAAPANVEFRTAAVPKSKAERTRVREKPVPVSQPAIPAPDQFAMLTAEEREAYDNLMLALSVTTSSLKLVQEKANGDLYAEPGPEDKEIQSRSN